MNIEKLILQNLIYNEEYTRKILPHLKEEYFKDVESDYYKTVYKFIRSFIDSYNERPSIDALKIHFNETIKDYSKLKELNIFINDLKIENKEENIQWLLDSTEKFCKDRAVELALIDCLSILNDKKDKRDRGIIPELLSDALSVSLDPSVGHDYFDDAQKRYEFYNKKEEKISFDIPYFNKITNGGLSRKTLNVILGGTNVGKTLAMCSFATGFLTAGYNVLYITLEMSEERISERIDANLLDVDLDILKKLSNAQYLRMIKNAKKNVAGRLFIKEYPTASASVINFRSLLKELEIKKKFKPDVIVVDYLSICASSRIKNNGVANTYVLVKSISEELRGLGVEYNVPILTGAQVTRSGYSDSDIDMTHIAESWGIAMSADFVFSIISTEELEKSSQFLIKQLKNRYNDRSLDKKHIVGVIKSKMRIFDLDNDSFNLKSEEENENSFEKLKNSRFEDFTFME